MGMEEKEDGKLGTREAWRELARRRINSGSNSGLNSGSNSGDGESPAGSEEARVRGDVGSVTNSNGNSGQLENAGNGLAGVSRGSGGHESGTGRNLSGSESGPRSSGSGGGNSDGGSERNPESQEKNASLVTFPEEAYFKSGPKAGQLKKVWLEKLAGTAAKPVATVKKKGKGYLDDKELMETVKEGIMVSFQMLDKGIDYGLGVSNVWELEESEAGVLARVLLRRADKGDKKAIQTVAALAENMDLLQAALIVVPRVGATIKEVAANGIKPHLSPRSK